MSGVASAAAAEIDNLGLRAELARQVEQVSESRTRLPTAHLDERRRIERDLHDGAQQLLAIALQLQSARVNGDAQVLGREVDDAVQQLASTVAVLRDLAGGLQPAALAGGGLRAAVEELVSRTPLLLTLDVTEERFAPVVESAAWFVVAEGSPTPSSTPAPTASRSARSGAAGTSSWRSTTTAPAARTLGGAGFRG